MFLFCSFSGFNVRIMARAAHLSLRPPRPPEGRPPAGAKGRGACSNDSGRYEVEKREAIDDGWDVDDGQMSPRTNVSFESPRKIITFNKSPYVGFDRSINPYRGCEHGCIYCFARPTHAYLGLSPGVDFERELTAKPSAPALLEKELSHKKYLPRAVAIGTNTDPYQPIERKFQIMRGLLTVFLKFSHPVSILTKSHLITRDIDLLTPLSESGLTRAMVSITTEDAALARSMEPRASSPPKRFEAIRRLSDAGVPTGVMTGPMIPGLNDDEMETILEKAKDAGAAFAAHTVIRLPLEVSRLFQEWLDAFAPDRANRIMRHIRDNNGGRDYDPHWSRGGEIKAPYAQLISQRFAAATRRLGFDRQPPALNLNAFRRPEELTPQLSLFNESPAD